MKSTPLEKFPVHQTSLPIAPALTSDRNFYDRYYFNAHDRPGEARHILLEGTRAMLNPSRFAQMGSWSGTLSVDGGDPVDDPEVRLGTRACPWGTRPSGESDPPSR